MLRGRPSFGRKEESLTAAVNSPPKTKDVRPRSRISRSRALLAPGPKTVPDRRLRDLVIRTSPYPPFRWAYASVYAGVLSWVVLRLKLSRQIRAVELKIPARGHCFGSSDLDLRAETAPLSTAAFFALCDSLAPFLLPAGSWRRIVDLCLFSEPELRLKRALEPENFLPARRLHILGPKPPPPAASHAPGEPYGRVMHNFTALCQEVFQGPLDPHHRRIAFRQILKIDDEVQACPAALAKIDPAERGEGVRIARDSAWRGRTSASLEDVMSAFLLAQDEAAALCGLAGNRPLDGNPGLARVGEAIPPDTLDRAALAVQTAITGLCRAQADAVQSVILGADPGCRYEYRIYFILRDELPFARRLEVSRALRELFAGPGSYNRISTDYFRLRFPILLTVTMWRAAARWYHVLRTAEEFYFLRRHGVVLFGDDLRDDLSPPTRADTLRSAAAAISDLRNIVWESVHHRQSARLADILLGRIPALWLLLSHATVATSPGEALAAGLSNGFPHATVVAELDRRIGGLPPRELPEATDPVWQPALNVLDEWLDDLLEMALCQLN
jgi:hypothetical protein